MPATQYNPAGVHGVDAVADALGVNPIEVNRLVARGRIKFTPTPKGPVITEDVLRAYTGAGALDLISDVRLSINGRDGEAWWPPCSPVDVDMVRAECVGWLENNPISQSRAASLAASNTNDALRVDVVPAGELLGILQSPITVPRALRRITEQSPFKSAGEMYAVHHLRLTTKRTIDRNMRLAPPLQKLYESPEAYAATTNDGYAAFQKLGVMAVHKFVVKAVSDQGQTPASNEPQEVFSDPSASLIPGMEGLTKLFQVGRRRLAVARLDDRGPKPTPPHPNDDTPRDYRARIVSIEQFLSFAAIGNAVGMTKDKLIERAF